MLRYTQHSQIKTKLRLAEEKNSDDYIGDKDKINPDA
jgi:hypothetical protein